MKKKQAHQSCLNNSHQKKISESIKVWVQDLQRKKRLKSLEEQIHFQNIFKKWMFCDKLMAALTIIGLVLVIGYHQQAINRLRNYCEEEGVSVTECKKEILKGRYGGIGVFFWDIVVIILNVLSVIFFWIGQKYKNQWFKMFR